ncbi:hypothetical protein CZ774_05120 [Frigoribacterium sp. JB110]|nr:hypothetical protein CZ774_05120 [Frigoribacterium sp. JB110]
MVRWLSLLIMVGVARVIGPLLHGRLSPELTPARFSFIPRQPGSAFAY